MASRLLSGLAAFFGADAAATAAGADQEWLRSCADMGADRLNGYSRYQEHYDGHHKARLTTRAKLYLQATGVEFAENFCEPVVDCFTNSMEVVGFGSTNEQLDDWITKVLWAENRMDAKQGVVHHQAALKGDGFLVAGFGPGRSGRNVPLLRYNRPECIKVEYEDDDPDKIAYAVKVWDTSLAGPSNPGGTRIRRMNVFYPDCIEKWFSPVSDSGLWAHWTEVDEFDNPALWPTPWIRPDGTPRGVPVFHFRHKAKGRTWGRSRLHGTIPQQALLNKMSLDLDAILDSQAWKQRWVTGAEEEMALKLVPGELWRMSSKDAKFGQLDADDAQGVMAAMEALLQRIGARSATPLHLLWLSGDIPSGESLKTARAPLVEAVKAEQTPTGNVWEDAVAMCAGLETDYGDETLDLTALGSLACQWRDPETRNEQEHRDGLATAVRDLGLSKHTALTELGYDPDQEAEQRAEEATTAAEAAMKAFSVGAPFGGGGGNANDPAADQ